MYLLLPYKSRFNKKLLKYSVSRQRVYEEFSNNEKKLTNWFLVVRLRKSILANMNPNK